MYFSARIFSNELLGLVFYFFCWTHKQRQAILVIGLAEVETNLARFIQAEQQPSVSWDCIKIY